VRGVVVEGDRRGRELGYPTANVAVPSRCCLPADGIYAGWFVGADGVERMTAISLGRRPTFYESADSSLLEAYVLDFDGDLYGHAVKVRFVARLRGEQKFDSIDALVAQIERDVEATRRALA
jgi:riboflavin kinase/FMN adenylyltransferase